LPIEAKVSFDQALVGALGRIGGLAVFRIFGCVSFAASEMKSRVEYRPYCVPFLRPVETAHGLWRERRGVIARWESGAGVAIGEGQSVHYAESAPLPHLPEGRSPLSSGGVPTAVRRTALAAEPWVNAGTPSFDNFAAPEPKDVSPREVAALLPAGRAAIEGLRGRRSEGFRTFKWKVGVASDPVEELDILEELCAELPERGGLRLDANGGWTQRVAERWLARCAEPRLAARIEFIEQPVWAGPKASEAEQRRVDDVLLGLSADYPTPIALDESVGGGVELREWLDRGWSGVYVVKPTLLAEPVAVFGELARAKARVVFSSAMETAVGAKAALRWAFAWVGDNGAGERYALGFGVYPIFQDAAFNGPRAVPFLRWEDVQAIDEEAVWNALA